MDYLIWPLLAAFFVTWIAAMICNIAAARAEGWRAAHHAWQDWLEANIPDWDAMAGIDLTTLPREPK
jgi:hypothetical protein